MKADPTTPSGGVKLTEQYLKKYSGHLSGYKLTGELSLEDKVDKQLIPVHPGEVLTEEFRF